VGIVLILWLENEKRRFETEMLDAVYKVEQGIRYGKVAEVDLLKETEKAFQDAARAQQRGEKFNNRVLWRLRDSVLRALDTEGHSETAIEIHQAVRDDLAKAKAELDKVKQTSSP
jgi:outer membrane murein-binding lipoprotein Lpp